jgi:predicted amidohydrolase
LVATKRYIKETIANGSNAVLFPEMSFTGYINPNTMPEAVLTPGSSSAQQFCAMTCDLPLMVMAGIVEKNPSGKLFIPSYAIRRA